MVVIFCYIKPRALSFTHGDRCIELHFSFQFFDSKILHLYTATELSEMKGNLSSSSILNDCVC